MFNSPVDILISGAIILIAAFLGSWLAFRINARGTATSAQEDIDPEIQTENAPPSQTKPAETQPIKHAFDFSEDRVTMILEMPIALLDDDRSLADGWVDVVSWARMARQDIQEGGVAATALPGDDSGVTLDESEITREHMENSLQRLHDAAERRRELRLKLAES